jgi:hypothetical protein
MYKPSLRIVISAAISAAALFVAACGSTSTGSGPASSTSTTSSSTTAPTNTPAPAAPTIVVAHNAQSGTDASAAQISVTATCPAGTALVSGGYSLTLANNTQLVTISDDYPSAPNAWTATELNPQSGGAITLTTYAYCAQGSAALSTTIATATASGGNAAAACPGGAALTGGGFHQAANGANVIAASYPVGNAWHTAQLSGVQHQAYSAYAVCASGGLAASGLPSAGATLANNATGEADAACAAGQTLVGGGFTAANGAYALITDLKLATSQTAWAAKALNLYVPPVTGPGGAPPTPTPLQLTAYGVCVTAA